MSRDRGEKTRRTSSSTTKTKAQKPARNQRGKRGGDEGDVEKTSILSMDFSDIGQALSPMAGGLLAGHLGYQGMFRVAAVPVLASAALALWFGLGANKESEE